MIERVLNDFDIDQIALLGVLEGSVLESMRN